MFLNLQLILILRVKDRESGVCDMLQAPQVQPSRYLSRVFITFELFNKRITLVFVS